MPTPLSEFVGPASQDWRLLASLAWKELLTAYGSRLNPITTALPCSIACPLCTGSMTIWRDPVALADWCSCNSCRFHGYPIDLLTRLWELSLTDTVTRLGRLGVCPSAPSSAVESYQKRQAAQEAWQARWQRATEELEGERGAAYRRLRESMDLVSDISPDRWVAGPGRLFGLWSREEVEQTVLELSGRVRRLPRMRAWDYVLVVPFFDLPGRLSDLWVAQQQAGKDQQMVLSVLPTSSSGAVSRGLAFVETTTHPVARWGQRILALRDIRLALQIHVRQASFSNTTLPIVGWIPSDSSPTYPAWSQLPSRPLLFAERKWDWDTLRTAAGCQADFLELPWPDATEIDAGFQSREITRLAPALRQQPDDALREARKRRKFWAVAAASRLPETSTVVVREFLQQLTAFQRERVFRELSPTHREQAEQALHPPFSERSFVDGDWLITERADGWYRSRAAKQKGSVLLSDAILRVRRIWAPPVDRYEGEILYRGKTWTFHTRGSLFRPSPAKWLEAFLIAKGAGSVYLRRPLRPDLWSISQRFCPPEICREEGIGWEAESQTMGFARWWQPVGQIPSRRSRLLPASVANDRIPFPEDLAAADFTFLSPDTPENNFLWDLLLSWTSQTTSPVFGLTPIPTLISGECVQPAVEQLAQAAGLRIHREKTRPAQSAAPTFWAREVSLISRRSFLPSHVSLLVPPNLARAWSINGVGSWVFAESPIQFSEEQLEVGRRLFGWLVSWAISCRGLVGARGPLLLRLIKTLRRWLKEKYQTTLPRSIRRGVRTPFWPVDIACSWFELLRWLRESGLEDRGITEAEKEAAVSTAFFAQALHYHDLPAIREELVALYLYRCGIGKIPKLDRRETKAWVFRRDKWNRMHTCPMADAPYHNFRDKVVRLVPKTAHSRGFTLHPIGDGSVRSTEERRWSS